MATGQTSPIKKLTQEQSRLWIKHISKDWTDRDNATIEEWHNWVNTQLKQYDAILSHKYTIWFFNEQKYTLWLLNTPND